MLVAQSSIWVGSHPRVGSSWVTKFSILSRLGSVGSGVGSNGATENAGPENDMTLTDQVVRVDIDVSDFDGPSSRGGH